MNNSAKTNFKTLTQFVEQNIEKWGIPGLAVGVFHQKKMMTAAFGVTHIDHPLPVTDGTLFQIGSITKTFVGTAVMRLVEMGKLDLDATIQTYLPKFNVADKAASTQATLRHLLTHTGGWVGDDFHDTGNGDDAIAKYIADMATLEQLAPVGTHYSYNNVGFGILGRIIEKITQQPFETALQELVIKPMGLQNVHLFPPDVMTHRFAVGHHTADGGTQVARPWAIGRSNHPAGGIACDIKDLLRYARFHLSNGTTTDSKQLLKIESLTQMQSPHATIWKNEHWGLSWGIKQIGLEWQISHGGGTKGQVCLLTLFPKYHFAVAILTNAGLGGVATTAITKLALKAYLELDPPKPQPIKTSEEELLEYAGRYSRPFADIELGILAGKLVGIITFKQGFPNKETPPSPSPPPMSMTLCEKDRLLVLDGPLKGATADIVRHANGSIGWLRISGRIHKKDRV